MRMMLGQIEPGAWVAKDSTGKIVAALASAANGAKGVQEFYGVLRNGPKFPFDPMDLSKFTWEVATKAPARWDEATLKAWAKVELGKTPDAFYNAKASW